MKLNLKFAKLTLIKLRTNPSDLSSLNQRFIKLKGRR